MKKWKHGTEVFVNIIVAYLVNFINFTSEFSNTSFVKTVINDSYSKLLITKLECERRPTDWHTQ